MSSSAATRQGGDKASSFVVTCNLLSQYIKEKGRSLGDLGLGMAPIAKNETYRPPTTMSLLPGVDVSGDDTKEHVSDRNATKSMDLFPQRAGFGLQTPPVAAAAAAAKNEETETKMNRLTIFYGGKVLVFDNFPAEKAKDLMMLAGKGCGVTKNNNSPSTVVSAAPTDTKNLSSSKFVPVAVSNSPVAATLPPRPAQTVVSDLPIARKASLHRFLEKRKDRINAKAPYQLNPAKDTPVSVANPKIEKYQPWLGLSPSPSSERSR